MVNALKEIKLTDKEDLGDPKRARSSGRWLVLEDCPGVGGYASCVCV